MLGGDGCNVPMLVLLGNRQRHARRALRCAQRMNRVRLHATRWSSTWQFIADDGARSEVAVVRQLQAEFGPLATQSWTVSVDGHVVPPEGGTGWSSEGAALDGAEAWIEERSP